jgi:hypothetical protein
VVLKHFKPEGTLAAIEALQIMAAEIKQVKARQGRA